jgi:tRNA threonylcarbamoyladenosine biosynthesis protein TsaE
MAGAVLCLAGELGAGKTTLAQGIARGWGALDSVTSPTFVLINEYRRADNEVLYHVDAFRLAAAAEAEALGIEELFEASSPVIVEWPGRIERLLPEEHLWIDMTWVDDSRRNLAFHAHGPQHEALLRGLRRAAFGG